MFLKKTKLFIFFIFSIVVTTNITEAITPNKLDEKGQKIIEFLLDVEKKAGTLFNDLNAQKNLGMEIVKILIEFYGSKNFDITELFTLKKENISDNLGKAINALAIEFLSVALEAQLEQYRINKIVKTKMEENINNKIDYYQYQIKVLIEAIRKKLNLPQPSTSPTSSRKKRITALLEKCNYGEIASCLKVKQKELIEKFKDSATKALNSLTDNDLTALETLSNGVTFAKVKAATTLTKFTTLIQEVACKLPASIQNTFNQAKAICCCA